MKDFDLIYHTPDSILAYLKKYLKVYAVSGGKGLKIRIFNVIIWELSTSNNLSFSQKSIPYKFYLKLVKP